jgi:branched-subunit amino acid ABC-type transport system permease component
MQELIGALSLASIYVLFALGMSLTWGTIDILNFAHGSIFMFSAFTAYLVLQTTPLGFFPMLLIGLVVGAIFSLLVQVLAFEQIIKRAKDKRSAEMQILIGGIGVAIIPLSIAQHYTKSNPFRVRELLVPGHQDLLRRLLDHQRPAHHHPPCRGAGHRHRVVAASVPAGPGAEVDRRRLRDRLDHGCRPP